MIQDLLFKRFLLKPIEVELDWVKVGTLIRQVSKLFLRELFVELKVIVQPIKRTSTNQ